MRPFAVSGRQRVRRRGVVGHCGLFARDVVDVDGIPVTNLADTWVDMGELIRPGVPLGLDDLVIMGDAVADRLGSITPLVEALDVLGLDVGDG